MFLSFYKTFLYILFFLHALYTLILKYFQKFFPFPLYWAGQLICLKTVTLPTKLYWELALLLFLNSLTKHHSFYPSYYLIKSGHFISTTTSLTCQVGKIVVCQWLLSIYFVTFNQASCYLYLSVDIKDFNQESLGSKIQK